MELRGPRNDLDITGLRPVLQTEIIVRKGTNDVQQEPARQDDRVRPALDLRVDLHADADLHVGGLQLHRPALFADEHTRERLDRAARRDTARGNAQSSEERFTGYRQLHLIKDSI